METQTDPLAGQPDEPDSDVASLSSIGLWRSTGSRSGKDGDITAMLAAMPAAPEVLSNFDDIQVPPGGAMRDVTPEEPRFRDIVEWWRTLRDGQTLPSRDRLKLSDVARLWPNLVLFRCGSVPGQLQPDSGFASALRGHRGTHEPVLPGGPEVTAMLSQWMLRVANKALAAKAPVPEETRFDTARGQVACRLVALPFGHDRRPDHILCQVEAR